MGQLFTPDFMQESAYSLDYETLFSKGIRGIIFDIDNTLVLPDAPSDERVRDLMERLTTSGFLVCVVSNNSEERVQAFAEAAGTLYVEKALKPFSRGYKRAMEIMGTGPSETACIGDQIFTDIWGANALGLTTVLVEPFTLDEEVQIRFKRMLEKPILRKLRQREGNV